MKPVNWKRVVARRSRSVAPKACQPKSENKPTRKSRARLSSDVDAVVNEIEKDTVCSEGFGREVGRTGIDLLLLANFVDPDEIENEERVCRHSERASKHDGDVVDGEVEAFLEGGDFEGHDFRDGITLHDPRRPSHRLKLKVHPECGKDEVYLLNVTRKAFDIIRWETKRMGKQTSCGCYPVFVKRSELHTAGYRLVKPKQRKTQAVA